MHLTLGCRVPGVAEAAHLGEGRSPAGSGAPLARLIVPTRRTCAQCVIGVEVKRRYMLTIEARCRAPKVTGALSITIYLRVGKKRMFLECL